MEWRSIKATPIWMKYSASLLLVEHIQKMRSYIIELMWMNYHTTNQVCEYNINKNIARIEEEQIKNFLNLIADDEVNWWRVRLKNLSSGSGLCYQRKRIAPFNSTCLSCLAAKKTFNPFLNWEIRITAKKNDIENLPFSNFRGESWYFHGNSY